MVTIQNDMTNEEAINHIENMANALQIFPDSKQGQALLRAIKALEQEPCEYAVSLQDVLKQLKSCLTGGETEYNYVKMHIDNIPPAIPKLKIGYWEHGKELSREYQGKTLVDIDYLNWYCSNCHYIIKQSIKPEWNYCPNCGSDMRESEKKNDLYNTR